MWLDQLSLTLWVILTFQTSTGNINRKKSRNFLKLVKDYFLVQVLRDPIRKSVLLDLLFVNRQGLMDEEVIGGCLGHTDYDVAEFQISDGRKTACKNSIFRLLKELVMQVPWESAF